MVRLHPWLDRLWLWMIGIAFVSMVSFRLIDWFENRRTENILVFVCVLALFGLYRRQRHT